MDSGINQIGGVAGASLLGNSADPAADGLAGLADSIARASLLSAYEKRGRFTVITKRQQFDNMVIQKLSFPKTTATGRKTDFSITFQQIRVARPFTVNVDQVGESVVDGATSEVKQGSKVTQGASAAQDKSINSSTLFKLFN